MATYRTLISILKRNGAQSITINSNEIYHFIKYTERIKLKEKLYYAPNKGVVKISNKPLNNN